MDEAGFRAAFDAKVAGSWVLHEVTREETLDFFALAQRRAERQKRDETSCSQHNQPSCPPSSGALLNFGATSFHQRQQRFARSESGRVRTIEPALRFEQLNITEQSTLLPTQTCPIGSFCFQFLAPLVSSGLEV